MTSPLRELRDVEVVLLTPTSSLLDLLREQVPDLVVADLDGANEFALDAANADALSWLFFTSDPLGTEAPRPPSGTARTLPKPVTAEILRDLVRDRLATLVNPPPFSAADYIQRASQGGHSVRVEVSAASLSGSIHVREGQVWSAHAGDACGKPALSRLLFLEEARVVCVSEPQRRTERNLPTLSCAYLLLEAARSTDEVERVPAPLLQDDSVSEALPPHPNGEPHSENALFKRLMNEAAAAVLSKSYDLAMRCYGSALEIRPTDALASANMRRLRDLLPTESGTS